MCRVRRIVNTELLRGVQLPCMHALKQSQAWKSLEACKHLLERWVRETDKILYFRWIYDNIVVTAKVTYLVWLTISVICLHDDQHFYECMTCTKF